MKSIFNQFFISLFTLIFCGALFINFWTWSGYNVMGATGLEDTYFGFTSFLNAVRYLNTLTSSNGDLNKVLIDSVTYLGNVVNFGIPQLNQTINTYLEGNMNALYLALNIGLFIFTFLFQPIIFTISLLVVFMVSLAYIIFIVETIFLAMSGQFNVIIPTTDFPEISEIVNNLCIC